MSTPAVNLNELDGALGVLPAGASAMAFVGPSAGGTLPVNTPAAFARTKDLLAALGDGPNTEAAAYWIQQYNRPAIVVRTAASVVGTHTNLTLSVTGTSVITITGADTNGNDDYEPYFVVVNGGTIGVAGITFQWSLDGGRTLSPVTALGVANAFVFPGSGGLGYSFAAGTLVAGDRASSRATAPNWNATELGAAITALKASTHQWDLCHIAGPIDATAYDTLVTLFSGTEKAWIGNTRMPNVGETEAAYKTALDTIFSAKAQVYGFLGAGAAKITSGISFRQYKRPISFTCAALAGSVSEEVDIAAINLGSLPGVDIRDINGNPDEHDEFINPGLDDSRFMTLRTFDGVQGVYVNNPRIHSATGSDFEFLQHRRVMNLTKKALRLYFLRRLSLPVLVSASTGFILETEALEIEAGADAILRGVLMAKPKASGGGAYGNRAKFLQLSRTDNLLSTKTLTGQAFVIPLAYPKFINLDVGFRNPALQVVAV